MPSEQPVHPREPLFPARMRAKFSGLNRHSCVHHGASTHSNLCNVAQTQHDCHRSSRAPVPSESIEWRYASREDREGPRHSVPRHRGRGGEAHGRFADAQLEHRTSGRSWEYEERYLS